ncbi:hypothetical protein MXB_4530 [Myxobolus squamalis]|nr:hypothetical protein MXB_4530 [Myxobolus squamalis]
MEEETGISGVPVNSSKKRQNKRNIREKRRSTGVIILPPSKEDWEHGIDGSEETEELKAAAINAAANENITSEDYNQIITASEDPPDFKIGELLTHKRELEEAITLWQEAYNHISSVGKLLIIIGIG